MLYIKKLSAVTPNELQAVGYRAQDLALLASHHIPHAASFVVLSTAFDEVMRLNNLKYKLDYILSHAQLTIQSSLLNAYSSARKAFGEAKLPNGFETELRDTYEQITTPLSVGELTTQRPSVRIIASTNLIDDPENNDTVIQNVNTFDELLIGIREAWAISYHPSQLGARLKERFPENRLKVALIVQVMEEPTTSCHAYSCLPQDHKKIYLQVYYGYADLRDRITKDYYAISKDSLQVIARQLREQNALLAHNSARELAPAPLPARGKTDKLIDRDIMELARLTRKAERVLQQPVKVFFTSKNDQHELLWANRLGFDIIIDDEPEQPQPSFTQEVQDVQEKTVEAGSTPAADDFIAAESVSAKLLQSSLKIVQQILERKYRSMFGETPADNIADMANRLNQASAFSRPVDGALLLQAAEAARNESSLSAAEYAKTIEEVAFLMSYA